MTRIRGILRHGTTEYNTGGATVEHGTADCNGTADYNGTADDNGTADYNGTTNYIGTANCNPPHHHNTPSGLPRKLIFCA
jgi:hypothetical protein